MKPVSNTIRGMPEIMWFQVFKHLTIHEFVGLRLVSKKLREYVNNYTAIYKRECLRIFTTDLELFGYFCKNFCL